MSVALAISMRLAPEIENRTAAPDPRLKLVDQLADRWSRLGFEGGRLHPLEAMRLMHDGAVLGGTSAPMADDVLAFDQEYAKAPTREKLVIDVWYCSGGSALQKAHRMHISRATLYLEWKAALSYMRGRLHGRGIAV